MELPQAIRDNYLFHGLSDANIDEILALATTKTFDGGDTILRQFGRDNDLLIILTGQALIKTFSGEPVAEVGAGSVLGEVSLIDTEPRSATVIARYECSVASIPAAGLKNLMRHDIEMRSIMLENLAKVLCQRLRSANMQLDVAYAVTVR